MKQNTLDYIERNQKEYKYYIKKKHRQVSALLSIIEIGFIGYLMILIRELFLEAEAWEAASRTIIEDMEVTEWVTIWIQEERWDWTLWSIIIITFSMMGIVFIANWTIKSYNLYKRSWLKWVPPVLTIILWGIIVRSYWYEQDSEYIPLIVIITIEQLPLVVNFTPFLPLEIREDYNFFINALSYIGEKIKKYM